MREAELITKQNEKKVQVNTDIENARVQQDQEGQVRQRYEYHTVNDRTAKRRLMVE